MNKKAMLIVDERRMKRNNNNYWDYYTIKNRKDKNYAYYFNLINIKLMLSNYYADNFTDKGKYSYAFLITIGLTDTTAPLRFYLRKYANDDMGVGGLFLLNNKPSKLITDFNNYIIKELNKQRIIAPVLDETLKQYQKGMTIYHRSKRTFMFGNANEVNYRRYNLTHLFNI